MSAGGWATWSPPEESLSKREHCYSDAMLQGAWDYLVRRLDADALAAPGRVSPVGSARRPGSQRGDARGVLLVRLPEEGDEPLVVGAGPLVEPGHERGGHGQRERRPGEQRQAGQEHQVPDVHGVAGVRVDPGRHEPLRPPLRHPGWTAGAGDPVGPGQPVLQEAPGQQRAATAGAADGGRAPARRGRAAGTAAKVRVDALRRDGLTGFLRVRGCGRSARAGTVMAAPTRATAGASGRTTTRPATASGAANSAAARKVPLTAIASPRSSGCTASAAVAGPSTCRAPAARPLTRARPRTARRGTRRRRSAPWSTPVTTIPPSTHPGRPPGRHAGGQRRSRAGRAVRHGDEEPDRRGGLPRRVEGHRDVGARAARARRRRSPRPSSRRPRPAGARADPAAGRRAGRRAAAGPAGASAGSPTRATPAATASASTGVSSESRPASDRAGEQADRGGQVHGGQGAGRAAARRGRRGSGCRSRSTRARRPAAAGPPRTARARRTATTMPQLTASSTPAAAMSSPVRQAAHHRAEDHAGPHLGDRGDRGQRADADGVAGPQRQQRERHAGDAERQRVDTRARRRGGDVAGRGARGAGPATTSPRSDLRRRSRSAAYSGASSK